MTNANEYIDGIHINELKDMDLTGSQYRKYAKIMMSRNRKIFQETKRSEITSIAESKLCFEGEDLSDIIELILDNNTFNIMSKNRKEVEDIFEDMGTDAGDVLEQIALLNQEEMKRQNYGWLK